MAFYIWTGGNPSSAEMRQKVTSLSQETNKCKPACRSHARVAGVVKCVADINFRLALRVMVENRCRPLEDAAHRSILSAAIYSRHMHAAAFVCVHCERTGRCHSPEAPSGSQAAPSLFLYIRCWPKKETSQTASERYFLTCWASNYRVSIIAQKTSCSLK